MKVYSNTINVNLGKNVNIINSAFSGTSIYELTISESVKEINGAFVDCSDLNDVTILSKDVSLEKSGIGFDYKNFMGNVIPENGLAEPFEDVTIRGYLDSTAETYARKYNFKFIGLDGTRGDSNEDSKLNIVDAAFIAKRVAQRKTDLLPLCADYNMDGNCDILDAAAIAKDVAKRILK